MPHSKAMSTPSPVIDLMIPTRVTSDVLALITMASNIVIDESDEADAFALLVDKVAKAAVPAAATVMIPERVPGSTEHEDFRFPLLFCKLQGVPGIRSTFGICTEYSRYGKKMLGLQKVSFSEKY